MKNYSFIMLAFLLINGCIKIDHNNATSISSAQIVNQLGIYDYDAKHIPDFAIGGFSISTEKARLGRALFYDKSLSINGGVSCGSCHVQQLGFADSKPFSDGFINEKTPMHSMSLVNMAANTAFFWDGRATNFFDLVLMPISNHIEMGLDNENLLIAKIKGSPMYEQLFINAFVSEEIEIKKISQALAHFVASLTSYNTKHDRVNRKEEVYSALEQKGLELFKDKYDCSSCHGGENFNFNWGVLAFANIGLDKESSLEKRFKVPSLRNVMVSAPYMHDGRFKNIEEVLNHYSNGIQNNPFLDWRLNRFAAVNGGMNITTEDKTALIAFLHTLTDQKLLTDPKFSNPF